MRQLQQETEQSAPAELENMPMVEGGEGYSMDPCHGLSEQLKL